MLTTVGMRTAIKRENWSQIEKLNAAKKKEIWDSPNDVINADNTLWLLFLENYSCLTNCPYIAAVSCQEAVTVSFCLTFADDCN